MYNQQQRKQLLELAFRSIQHGLTQKTPLAIKLEIYDPLLNHNRACFVTLHKKGKLRGCIGSLQAYRPLLVDISNNAFSAAFNDPRFPPVTNEELNELDIEISVLSPSSPIVFKTEKELLEQIQVGVDGLIIEDKGRRGTFLPSVWKQLPSKELFLQHLKQKAGLPINYWSDSLQVSRYHTESFS